MYSFFNKQFTEREAHLANHVKTAAWAIEARDDGDKREARLYASWAREWLQSFCRS